MEPSWVPYTRQRTRSDQTPILGIQQRFRASMNRAFYQGIGSPQKVSLLFDPKLHLIGVRNGDGDPSAYTVSTAPGGGTWLFSLAAFIHHHGIKIDPPQRFTGQLIGDVMAFDVSEPLKASSKNTGGSGHAQRRA